MNVNCKVSLTDEQRNVMFRRLTGKNGKAMVSRADVNGWIKEQLERFLTIGSPVQAEINNEPDLPAIDPSDIDVNELIRQNELLTTRVNRLQYALDRRNS